MNKVEKIKAEIERRKKTWNHQDPQYVAGGKDVCDYLLGFIDSLEEEPVSNDLEEAVVEAFKQIVDSDKNSFLEIFKAGAQWGMRQVEAKIQAQSMALAHGCPKEFVSNDLEETSKQYALNNSPWDDCWPEVQDAFKAGAQWQKEQMMKNSTFINEVEWEDDIHKLFREKGKKVKLMIVEEE